MTPAGYQVQIGNADGSLMDSNQIAKLALYTTTNLAQAISSWDVVTNTGWLTNGTYLLNFPADGSPARFWQAAQQP